MNWHPTAHRAHDLSAPKPAPVTDKRPRLRPCRASWLSPQGDIDDTRFLIPAHPVFESAFCGFARGTLVDTPNGPVAIEDLLPGDAIFTDTGDIRPVTWIGATTLVPQSSKFAARSVPLYRILPDAFGLARPLSHMVVGPSARFLGQDGQILNPLSRFEDGVNVTALTPPTPVEMFHLCLEDHALIRMGGIAFESYHPGRGAMHDLSPSMRELFLKLFPQIETLSDFGAMAHPREPDPMDDATAA